MKKNTVALLLIGILSFIAINSSPAYSQDDPAVEKRIKKIEKENETLKELVKQLQDRLDKIEGQEPKKTKKKDSDKPEDESSNKKEKKIDDKEKESDKQELAPKHKTSVADINGYDEGKDDESWLPSRLGEKFRFGGRVQVEYFNSENESLLQSAIPDSPGGSFHLDELSLYLDADLKNDIRLFSKIDIHGEDYGLLDAYADFEDLPLSSALRVGLHKRFYRPNRYTETYPITGIAFWRSRILGLTWTGKYDPVYAHLSIANGPQLDKRQLMEDESSEMISDDNIDFDLNGDKELSAGIGLKLDFDNYGELDIMGFGMIGELSDDDIDYLQGDVPGYGLFFDDKKELVGANLSYDINKWNFFSQAIAGTDGEMDRFSWYSELSYLFEIDGMRYLNSIRPLVRYGELDNNLTPQPYAKRGSMTWDRQQWLFAVIAELVRNVNFRAEYALNDEETGAQDANNNEFLFQLEVRF